MDRYNKFHPFLASIKERSPLSKAGSLKNTQHLVIDIRGSELVYEVGDSVGIVPEHDPDLVFKTLKAMKADGQERVHFKGAETEISLAECLKSKSNITNISPKLLREIHQRQPDEQKKHELSLLLEETNREALKAYLAKHEIWDLLEAHSEVTFRPQEVIDLLMPLLPRFYSIASSQKHVGDEIHLTVAPLEYETNGHKRRGVCTHFICELAPIGQPMIPVFIQPAHSFRLPEDHHTDIIMIGPGTGVAPFRAFLQERLIYTKSRGKHWLFFGEKHRASDFFYENDWNDFTNHGHLKLETAFSRDQAHKIYVQHKLWENGHEVFQWLEGGAFLYVCGDAQRMAKDVEAMLQSIIQEFGMHDEAAAREYIKRLRKEKRYLRDVY